MESVNLAFISVSNDVLYCAGTINSSPEWVEVTEAPLTTHYLLLQLPTYRREIDTQNE